jgi:S-adenosylmethionine:tRNA ribosyltransferase-isomerase
MPAVLPAGLVATEPPEARGLRRDGVRLVVAGRSGLRHARFADLPRHLRPGDLLVVNTSATLPAAVDGHRAGSARGPVTVHFSTALDDGTWVVELRPPHRGSGPVLDGAAGERVALPGGVVLTLLAGHPGGGPTSERLWRARTSAGVGRLLAEHGRPVAYGYLTRRWPLAAYQTVFARQDTPEVVASTDVARADVARADVVSGEGRPSARFRSLAEGSAEMPSAGRPFTTELVTELVSAGIAVAPIVLHTGVSSLEKHEPPLAEPYRVPPATARLVNATRAAGGRVIAVGTTVTRALETVAGADGSVTAGAGWTELVLGPGRPARAVDGLITGWHEPGASHLLLLRAVAGPELVEAAYRAAFREHYLWHEFGDSCLLLP